MNENQKKKISLATLIFIILAIILFILTIWLVYCNQKESVNNSQTISKLEGQIYNLQATINNADKEQKEELNANKEIKLTKSDKVAINAGLEYGFGVALRYITNDNLSSIEYNTNLLEKELNKYYMVVFSRKEDDIKFIKGEATGEVSLQLETLKKYYNKVLGTDMDEQALVSELNTVDTDVSIKDGILYDVIVTGWGNEPMALKAKSLTLDETTKTYTLTTDFLYTENVSIKDQEDDYAGKYDTLEYSNLLVKAQLEIKYQEKENGEKILTSLVFKK